MGAPITDPSDLMEAILRSEFAEYQQIYTNATADQQAAIDEVFDGKKVFEDANEAASWYQDNEDSQDVLAAAKAKLEGIFGSA